MPIAPDIPAAEAAIVETTNAFRKQHARAAVAPNPLLAAAARAYAEILAKRNGALSHTIDGTTPETRAATAGYEICEIAENLIMLYDSAGFTASEYARQAMQGWEASPGHRQNLLMSDVTEIGVGVARTAGDPRYIAVQIFARPLSLRYSFKIINKGPRAVDYAFAGESHTVVPRQIITHSSCAPGALTFKLTGPRSAKPYEAQDGQVYTLGPDGGVTVEGGQARHN